MHLGSSVRTNAGIIGKNIGSDGYAESSEFSAVLVLIILRERLPFLVFDSVTNLLKPLWR